MYGEIGESVKIFPTPKRVKCRNSHLFKCLGIYFPKNKTPNATFSERNSLYGILLCPEFSKNHTKTMVELCAKFIESVEVVEPVAVVQRIGVAGFFQSHRSCNSGITTFNGFKHNREVGDIKFCVYTQPFEEVTTFFSLKFEVRSLKFEVRSWLRA